MPVFNVGPTVRQCRIHVSSWNEVPKKIPRLPLPPFSHTQDMKMDTDKASVDMHTDIVTGM